ncbi:MAG: heat-inducible transcriptional repressor HrcA [Actinobacteria bacterium]|nr:heat-inducible transcriptional repressor HrcA [Actinomycetota bacterium]
METTDQTSPDDLDLRKAAILQAVVSEYIGTAQPVGSSTVANAAHLEVSSATIRAEMVALEREGYLVQPHTSAGRVPTDKGYRFFVDHLAKPGKLGLGQRRAVESFFETTRGETEAVLERASGLLSDLTHQTAVVVGPAHTAAVVRSVQVVDLGASTALVVVVLADGTVEKRSMDLSPSAEVAEVASRALTAALAGSVLSSVPSIPVLGNPELDAVMFSCGAALQEIAEELSHERMFVGGNARLAESFGAVDIVRDVLAILEQQLVVVTLLRDVIERGLSVAIGEEHGYAPLASCAVVVAPVEFDDQTRGLVGLLGPTRMNYAESLAAAKLVGDRLGARLGSSHGDQDG